MSPPVPRLIEYLRSFQTRKAMYVQPLDVPNVQSFLSGFRIGCTAGGLDLSPELGWEAAKRRGWNCDAAESPVVPMRERGMSEDAIMDELIEIEILWLQLLASPSGHPECPGGNEKN